MRAFTSALLSAIAVSAGNEQLLRAVAPPAIRVREVRYELCGGLIEHARLRAGLLSIGHEAVDAPMADDLHHAPLFDAMVAGHPVLAIVGILGGEPCLFLDDAAIEIRKDQRSIRRGLAPHGAKIRVRAADEFALRECVVRHAEPVLPVDATHAQQPAHGFTCHHAPVKLRHEMAAQHSLATARGEVAQHALLVRLVPAGGLVPHFARRIRNAVAIGVLVQLQDGVARRELKGVRGIRAARPCAKEPAIVIAREAPLADAPHRVLARNELPARIAEAEIIGADRVVQIPQQP
jgi:hypothetical protein